MQVIHNSLGGFCFFHQPTVDSWPVPCDSSYDLFFCKNIDYKCLSTFFNWLYLQVFWLNKEITCPLLWVGRVDKLEILPTRCLLPLWKGGQIKIHLNCSVAFYTVWVLLIVEGWQCHSSHSQSFGFKWIVLSLAIQLPYLLIFMTTGAPKVYAIFIHKWQYVVFPIANNCMF